MSDQAAFYEFIRKSNRQVALALDIASETVVVFGRVTWMDPYAIGFQPTDEHALGLRLLGMAVGQTSLVMKKSIVSVTPTREEKKDGIRGNGS